MSFVEIYSAKAITAFQDNGASVAEAARYATFCFFAGVVAVYILDGIVHAITAFAIWLKKKELKKLPVSERPPHHAGAEGAPV